MSITTKTITFTAIIAALLALPLVLKKHQDKLVRPEVLRGGTLSGELLRYDIDDLLT